MAGLVAEDEVPFIAVAGAFLVQSNALSTMGKLLIALETGLNLTPKSRVRPKSRGREEDTYASLDSTAVGAVSGSSGAKSLKRGHVDRSIGAAGERLQLGTVGNL